MTSFELLLKSVAKEHVIGKEFTGPYWELGGTLDDCYTWFRDHSDSVNGAMRVFYYDNPKEVSPEKCRSLICIPVKEGVAVPDGFESREIPEQLVISVVYKGTHYSADKYKAYQALRDWIVQNQTQYAYASEPLMEIYLNSLVDTPESELLTDICLPVKKI